LFDCLVSVYIFYFKHFTIFNVWFVGSSLVKWAHVNSLERPREPESWAARAGHMVAEIWQIDLAKHPKKISALTKVCPTRDSFLFIVEVKR